MSDSENESYHSDTEQENDFEEESDYSDEESLDPEQEPTFKPHIKIGSKIDADIGVESDEEDEEDEVELGINEDYEEDVEQTASPFGAEINDEEFLDVEVSDSDEEDTEEEDDDEDFLQKFDREVVEDYIGDMHPESKIHNYDEVRALTNVIRNHQGAIVDDLHTTIPVLTKYEKTRVLGLRGKQLDAGAQPLVKVPNTVIDGYTIALMELKQKMIPFVIRRPLPNGGCEYWKVSDLELP
jgi:DNA-directed RNA polymerase subunit K/omega